MLQSKFGPVVLPIPTAASLRDSAAEWFNLAEGHFARAQAELEAGNLDAAIEQNRFAEIKLATARMRMIEAQAMERGS